MVHPRGQARAVVEEVELPGESVGVGYASFPGKSGEQSPHPVPVRFGGVLHGTASGGLGTGHHERAPVERGIGELLALGVEDAEQLCLACCLREDLNAVGVKGHVSRDRVHRRVGRLVGPDGV
jgi:hypothetical protein